MRRHVISRVCVWTVILAAGLLISACGNGTEETATAAASSPAVPVRVLTVRPQNFVEYGEYYGDVKPVKEATIQTVAGGRVDAVLAAPGDRVKAGQSLAHIEAERARSLYETAVLSEQIARRDYETKKKLQSNGNASDMAVDQSHLAWLQAKTAMIDAQKALDGALAVSPLDGVVVARYIEPYDELRPGQLTFTVADLSEMKVTVGVPEADIAGVGTLHSAEVRLAAIPDRVWNGTPVSLAKQRSAGTLAFEIQVVVDNREGLLLSGTTARVRLGLRELQGQIVIPTSAIRSEGDLTYVMIANSTTARRVAVATGPTDLTHSVITRGLSEGDSLIIEGINQVRDGDPVEIRL